MTRAAVLLLLAARTARADAAAPWARLAEPADGAVVARDEQGRVSLTFETGGDVEGLRLCAQLTNKRVSYESFRGRAGQHVEGTAPRRLARQSPFGTRPPKSIERAAVINFNGQ